MAGEVKRIIVGINLSICTIIVHVNLNGNNLVLVTEELLEEESGVGVLSTITGLTHEGVSTIVVDDTNSLFLNMAGYNKHNTNSVGKGVFKLRANNLDRIDTEVRSMVGSLCHTEIVCGVEVVRRVSVGVITIDYAIDSAGLTVVLVIIKVGVKALGVASVPVALLGNELSACIVLSGNEGNVVGILIVLVIYALEPVEVAEDTDNAKCYEILGTPENIEQRNMFLKFKVRRVKGGS